MPIIDTAIARHRYAHGTRARYILGQCRCASCRRANRDYENARQKAQRPPYHIRYSPSAHRWVIRNAKTGKIVFRVDGDDKAQALKKLARLNAHHGARPADTALVSTTSVCKHIAALRRHGIGVRQIAEAAHVNRKVITRMINPSSRPIVRTRAETRDRILAVRPNALPVRNGARTSVHTTSILLYRLLASGYTRSFINHELGNRSDNLVIHNFRVRWISVLKARAVHDLYLRLQTSDRRLPKISDTFEPDALYPISKRGAAKSPTQRAGAHGSAGRYDAGCRCARCVQAHDTLEAVQSTSVLPPHSRFYIALSRNRHYKVLDARRNRIVFRSADRALCLSVRDAYNEQEPATAGQSRVKSDQTKLLIDRLIACGFEIPWLSELLGCQSDLLRKIGPSVRLDLARSILALYASLTVRIAALRAIELASSSEAA